MARQLAAQGCRVAMTGRRADKLKAAADAARAAGGEVVELVGSASEPATVKAHYAELKKRWGGLDWAILNAGVGDSLNAREFSSQNFRWTYETNVFGVTEWMEALLPDMLAAGSGTIAGIASLAGFRGLPNSGSYSSSKAALIALLESARVDLRGTGVTIVTVCPGFVRSEMTDRNDARDMAFLLETEDGARRILRGVEAGKRLVHFPWQLSVPMKYLVARMPDAFYDWFAGTFLKRRKKKRAYVDESRRAAP
jgi:short-subunit dehydrogenase